MKHINIILLLIAVSIISSASFKLKSKYIMRSGPDNFYLTFLNKNAFELEMYSCLYQMKITGIYKKDADTIAFTYKTYKHLDDERKNWIPMDSAQIESKKEFLKRYSKLICEDQDKILRTADTRMRRTFRDIKEPYSEF